MHSELFAHTMGALGLDKPYAAYRDLLPASILATGNLVTMFGLHRAWRAACVGHLALFEMTSVGPMGRYSRALRKFGIGPVGRDFYDVHVEVDAWHEQVAQEPLVAGFLEREPPVRGSGPLRRPGSHGGEVTNERTFARRVVPKSVVTPRTALGANRGLTFGGTESQAGRPLSAGQAGFPASRWLTVLNPRCG